jgi:hypothetical protein
MRAAMLYVRIAEQKIKMENFSWDNKSGMRVIIDCWSFSNLSYALILYPNNVLHLQWLSLSK